MKKILFLTNTSAKGGAENQIFNLIKGLKNKFQLDFAVLYRAKADSLENAYKRNKITFINLNQIFKFSVMSIIKLKKILKNYQIFHLNLFQAEITGLLAALCCGYKGRIIVTIHNTEYFYQNRIISFLYRVFLSWRVDEYIAISKAVKNYFVEKTRIKAEKVKVIYYGIDNPFSKKFYVNKNKVNSFVRVGLIGRYNQQKGHQYLIKAMPAILKEYPEFKFYFIGRDEKNMAGKFISLAKRHRVEKYIILQDFIGDVEKLYQGIDLLILPSLWEGFGLVLLEAMYAKIPIIASAVGPIPEIIKNNYNGLLIKPGNPDSIIEVFNKIKGNKVNLKKLIDNAYAYVGKNFNLSTMVKKHTELYNSVIKY